MIKYLTILFFLSLPINIVAQDIPVSEFAFQDGEKVTYKLFYNWKFVWIPAGEVVFEVKEKNDHFEFAVNGYSYESYDSFFKVRDYYQSRASKENLLPINFKRNILEGNYTCFDSISFDQRNYSVFEKFGKTESQAETFRFQLKNTVLDMLSAIYYLRSLPIENIECDTELPFRIFFDKEYFDLNITYKGKEKIKVKELGKVKALHFQPSLITGSVFKEGDVMDIYVSDDENKIPLLIQSPVSVGSVKAILKNTSGLKNESDFAIEN